MNLKEDQNKVYGSALGPDWSFDLAMKGQYKEVVLSCCNTTTEILRSVANRVHFNPFSRVKFQWNTTVK